MKLPNLRLYDTQATFSLGVALCGILGVLALAVVVFKGFNAENMSVLYNPEQGLGAYRGPLVYLFTTGTFLLGALSGLLGFNSLGQRRNTRQSFSWVGMTLGALAMAGAPILFYSWRQFSEPLIQNLGP